MYYVYEWFNKKTNKVFYVGKGTRFRYKVKKHNKLFNDYIKNNDCESRIIRYFENEQDAFDYEYERYCELRAKGECECNINKAGSGGSTKWWTPEKREYYSKNNVMKSQKQRERMSKNNPMKNKQIALRVGKTNRRAVIINDIEYSSIKEVIEKYNTSWDCINYWCKRGINPQGEICKFKDTVQVFYDGTRYNKGSCKGITYKNKHYESPIDVAKELNIGVHKVYLWAKNGFDEYGNICRYDNDTRKLNFEHKKGRKHPIIVNGIKYQSISEAGKCLNITPQYIGDILRGKIKSTKYICKYDNQQPSISLKG